MSPVVKRKKERYVLSTKYWLLILSLLCVTTMIVSFNTDLFSKPLRAISGYVVVPFQKGLTNVGSYILNRTENFKDFQTVLAENEDLKAQIEELTKENIELSQDKYELTRLRELYELDVETEEYSKVGARIVARDTGNWYSDFVIDKGSNDGICVDCNVIAGNGLVGRVVSVGPNFSRVSSIITDNVNTSAMILSTGDNLIVTGDLKLMNNNVISFSQLYDNEDKVKIGDKIVTSNISDKYLPGLLVGYVEVISRDSNNLTKSGTLIPAVDFRHLEDVLVIMELKHTGDEEEKEDDGKDYDKEE